MFKVLAGVATLVLLCSGCASVTQGMTHTLRIDTETAQGQFVDGADCSLTNVQGMTVARSGGATLVRRSSKDLEVRCTTPGQLSMRCSIGATSATARRWPQHQARR